MEVIAFYSPSKIIPMLFLLLLLAGILLWGGWAAWSDPKDFFHFGVFRTYALTTGSVLYILYLPRFAKLFRQVLFKKMQAVWIEGGCLIYLDRGFFCIPCENIAQMRLNIFGPYSQEGIDILKKDGQTKVLPVGTFSESSDVILNRLRTACPGSLAAPR